MGKISDRSIREVKERVDLRELIGENIKLTKRGRSWIGLCPFHQEKTPSFHVTPERGIYHCFGCGAHGNAISYLMEAEGLTFPEALEQLAQKAGIELEREGDEGYTKKSKGEREREERFRQELYRANSVAAAFFERQLESHKHCRLAKEELERRGLGGTEELVTEALKAFRVGYAPNEWDGLAKHFRAQGIAPTIAEKAGLLIVRQKGPGNYDRFRHRLMFAVCDTQGRVVAFSGRVLPDPETGEVDKQTGKYINSPETPIYRKGQLLFGLSQGKRAIRHSEEVVFVEGNFDVVSLHARGLCNVVAPLGTAFTPEQARLAKRYAQKGILLFDGDKAGAKATAAAREPAQEAGLFVRAAVLPEGMDPDDFVRERGVEALQKNLNAAPPLLDRLLGMALDEVDQAQSDQERLAGLDGISALLASEKDEAVRHQLDGKISAALARILGRAQSAGVGNPAGMEVNQASFRSVYRRMQEALRANQRQKLENEGSPVIIPRRAARTADRSGHVTEAILGALMDFPILLDDAEVCNTLNFLDGDAVFLVSHLRNAAQGNELTVDTEEFLAQLPPTVHAFARRRMAAPLHLEQASARMVLLENARKLRNRALSQQNAEVGDELARAAASGDDEQQLDLLREVMARAELKRRKNS